jgi:hypothetical protein
MVLSFTCPLRLHAAACDAPRTDLSGITEYYLTKCRVCIAYYISASGAHPLLRFLNFVVLGLIKSATTFLPLPANARDRTFILAIAKTRLQ